MIKFTEFLQEAIAIDKINTTKGSTEVAVIQGRFQPPTASHLNIIRDAYKKTKNEVVIFIIKSKNINSPFDVDIIKKIMKNALKIPYSIHVINNGFIGEFIDILRNKDKEPTTFWCGSDRIKSYEGQVKRYKDKINLDLEIKEIKRTDNDISASKVRESLKNNDKETFKKMMDKSSIEFFDILKGKLK